MQIKSSQIGPGKITIEKKSASEGKFGCWVRRNIQPSWTIFPKSSIVHISSRFAKGPNILRLANQKKEGSEGIHAELLGDLSVNVKIEKKGVGTKFGD